MKSYKVYYLVGRAKSYLGTVCARNVNDACNRARGIWPVGSNHSLEVVPS